VQVPAGYRTLKARVVTPGLIDAHTVVGLAGYLNQPHDQDQLERSDAIQPSLRAVDAYNAREPLVDWLRQFGVTTLHTGHGPGALVSGQTMLVKTRGGSIDEAVIDTLATVAMTLGTGGLVELHAAGHAREGRGHAQREAGRGAGLHRAARRTATPHSVRPATSTSRCPRRRARPPRAAAHHGAARRQRDPRRTAAPAGVRLPHDPGRRGGVVPAAPDEIRRGRRAGHPAPDHGAARRHAGERDARDGEDCCATPASPVALQSGFEGYVPKTRVVLFEAAMAAAYGLPFEQALATITIDAARILGIADRVGSLEAGKHGDVVLFDGDPFEYTSKVCAVIIEGQVVRRAARAGGRGRGTYPGCQPWLIPATLLQ
jgi:hypothetical protein